MKNLPKTFQWLILIAFAALMISLFRYLDIPAALLLGAMIAAVIVSISGFSLTLPRKFFYFAQSIIGCMVAQRLSIPALNILSSHWLLVLMVMGSTLAFSFFIGWILAKKTPLPGSTAVWGASPGGASMMVLMSMDYPDADPRLVAFMQYFRILIVSAIAIMISHALMSSTPEHALPHRDVIWFPPVTGLLIVTLIFAVVSGMAGKYLRIPSPYVLSPLIFATILQTTEVLTLELPEWLLGLAYILIGFGVGVRFTQETVKMAIKVLPAITAAILAIVLFCMGLAWLLADIMQVDFFTAYLATSPGGMDAIAIIAANAPVEISLVMAIQTVRLIMTLVLSPIIAKYIAKHTT